MSEENNDKKVTIEKSEDGVVVTVKGVEKENPVGDDLFGQDVVSVSRPKRKYSHENYIKNKEKTRAWYAKNRERILQKHREKRQKKRNEELAKKAGTPVRDEHVKL